MLLYCDVVKTAENQTSNLEKSEWPHQPSLPEPEPASALTLTDMQSVCCLAASESQSQEQLKAVKMNLGRHYVEILNF